METKANRNSLIEILRFVFAFFILFYHDLFVIEMPIFNNANYFVDFFFLITGFYMLKTIKKYDEKPAHIGAYELLLDRIKKIGLPLLISYVAILLDGFFTNRPTLAMRYLWFIHIMLLMYLLLFLIYRLVKRNEKVFNIILGFVVGISFCLRFGSLFVPDIKVLDTIYTFDEIRGVFMISLGALINLIPKIKFENRKRQLSISVPIVVGFIFLLLVGLPFSAITLTYKKIVELIADLILFPGIFYFSQYLHFQNKYADFLGSCSIYIYIYQCISLFEKSLGVTSRIVIFFSIMIVTVITVIWKNEIKRKKDKTIVKTC